MSRVDKVVDAICAFLDSAADVERRFADHYKAIRRNSRAELHEHGETVLREAAKAIREKNQNASVIN